MSKKYGKITDTAVTKTLFMTNHIGKASTEINGKKVEIEMLTSMQYSPMIRCGKKYFALSWEDILNMAIDAGVCE